MLYDEMKEFIEGYKACALWATHDLREDGSDVMMDEAHKEWSAEAIKEIEEDCNAFVGANIALLVDWTASNAGHSFFLSRNGHGAGFFDYPDKNGDELQKAADVYSTSEPYTGDDGLTYLHH